MKNVPALALGIALLAVAGCKPQTETIPEESLGAFEKAFNAGDAAALAAIYAEDAIEMPPNAPANKGRAAIEQATQAAFAQGPLKISIAQDELHVANGMAMRRGTFRLAAPDGTEVGTGKFVEVWKKNGKQWEIYWDIYNTDAPPAPAAAPTPETPPAEPTPPKT